MCKICMCMAEGLEEVECLSVTDMLRRGGVEVVLVSMGDSEMVTSSHGVTIKADQMWSGQLCESCDGIFLPGGMPGMTNLAAHEELGEMLVKFNEEKKLVAAICAGPSVLGKYGILEGKKATCYPGFEKYLTGAEHVSDGVVTDGNVVTGRGVGFAIDEGLELLRILKGQECADRIREQIQHP